MSKEPNGHLSPLTELEIARLTALESRSDSLTRELGTVQATLFTMDFRQAQFGGQLVDLKSMLMKALEKLDANETLLRKLCIMMEARRDG